MGDRDWLFTLYGNKLQLKSEQLYFNPCYYREKEKDQGHRRQLGSSLE